MSVMLKLAVVGEVTESILTISELSKFDFNITRVIVHTDKRADTARSAPNYTGFRSKRAIIPIRHVMAVSNDIYPL